VAALVVVLTHSLGSVSVGWELLLTLIETPLVPLINAKVAVQVFFVLSGFVLAGSLDRNRSRQDLPQFYIRRIFRIHPPYMAALLFAWLASFLYQPLRNELSQLATILWKVHLSLPDLARHLLFPSSAGLQLPVGWTLKIEMIFSFLMPLMLWFARRTHVVLLLALCLLPFAIGPRGHPTLKFALDFAFGIALYLEGPRLRAWFDRIGGIGVWVWVGGWLAIGNLPLSLHWPFLIEGGSRESVFLQSLGSAGLVAAVAHAPAISRLFRGRRCLFFGRISYSVYLLHFPVALLAISIPWTGSDLFVVPVVFAITIPLATLSYYFVERPSIGLGNLICAWVARRTGGATVASRLESSGS
jgi:peptidoglycan/LPS O-acetylase OafA/YrhL